MVKPTEVASPARRKIAAARSDLILDEPFFGALVLRLKLIEDPNAYEPGAGLPSMWTDGTSLGFHPDFVMNTPAPELLGVLKHEVLHCSNGHPWRRDARDPYRWNEACDRAINPVLREMGSVLPANVLYELEPAHLGKSAEWIYDRLPDQQQDPRQGGSGGTGGGQAQQAQGPGGKKGQGKAPGSGQGQSTSQGGGSPEQGKAPPRRMMGEVRDAPSGTEEGEPPASEEDWRQATIQAAVMAKGQGKLPAGMERLLEQIEEPKVDWRSAMRRFAQEVAKSDYSFARPNQRYVRHSLYLPALHSHEVGPLLIGVDTSGSIDATLLAQFEAEVRAVADEVRPRRIEVVYCDAEIARVEVYERDEPVKLKPCGGGGTDFRPVFEHAVQMEEEPVALIYLTDLAGTFPKEDPGIPTLWVTTEHDEHRGVPFGEIVVAS